MKGQNEIQPSVQTDAITYSVYIAGPDVQMRMMAGKEAVRKVIGNMEISHYKVRTSELLH